LNVKKGTIEFEIYYPKQVKIITRDALINPKRRARI